MKKETAEVLENIIDTEKNKNPLSTIELENPELQDNSYISQSEICSTVDTVVPASMRYDMHKAIETVDRRVNGVDEYVAEKLGYIVGNCSMDQRKKGLKCLCDAFSAEQVDAIAVAIFNIEQRNQGVIIGDQTGIGKGRIAAAMIRYAVNRGLKPIFLTEKPNLFSDLYRDIINIGSDDAVALEFMQGYKEVERSLAGAEVSDDGEAEADEEGFEEEETTVIRVPVYKANKNYSSDIKGKRRTVPYIINGRSSKTTVKDELGNILYKGLPKNENDNIISSGRVGKEYNFILGTYSQFRGATISAKMQFLLQVAQGNVVIMDESHNASGSSNTGAFLRKALEGTEGVTFLSATFAKRPDNMPIYASKTAMSDANMTNEDLVMAIESGGVALQEIVSSQLVLEGQMIRRERSFEGIEVNYIYLNASQDLRGFPNLNKEVEHRAIMDASTDIIREILAFQRDYINPEIEAMDRIAKAEYKEVRERKGTKEGGISNPPVFSGIFNIINQLLFAIKAQAVAEQAIERLKEGKKPVIAFANTMESFLNTMVDDEGNPVEENDVINSDFSKVFEKRLAGVLRYTVIGADGKREQEVIDITSMSKDVQVEYARIMTKIKSTSIGICSSPIDVLINLIEKAGFSVAEVTGRDRQLKLLDGNKAVIRSRVKQSPVDAFRQFNSNEVDCLLINQSGSTGASAHALPNAKVPAGSVRQRVMIILQAELNINTEVQKRGRINRTGQIFKPVYDYVISAIPAEQRLMMMLQKKLKSLDANTTSDQKQSKKVLDVDDFLNKYGDIIVVDYLKDNPLVNIVIGDPLKLQELEEGAESQVSDKAHKVSGRIAILSVKEQEDFYREMTERYIALIDYLVQTGEYDLEVENLNLQAELIEKEIVVVGKGGDSVFGRHSILEKVKVNNLKKPFSQKEVESIIKESLGEFTAEQIKASTIEKYERFVEMTLKNDITDIQDHYRALITNVPKERAIAGLPAGERAGMVSERTAALEEARDAAISRTKSISSNKKEFIGRMLAFFTVGKVVGYPSVTFSLDGSYSKGIFVGFDIKENLKNPYAPSAMKLRFALASSQKYVGVPASKSDIITAVRAITYENVFPDEQRTFLSKWDGIVKEKSLDKITRFIVTGNILQAFGKEELKGSLISYTTSTGGVKKGILLPEGFSKDANRAKDKSALRITVPISVALPIIKSMIEGRAIETNDGFVFIRMNDNYRISAPAAKNRGGKFYLDAVIMKLSTEGLFNKVSDQMVATLELKKIDNLVNYLQDQFNSSVDLVQQEFDRIKGGISMEDYSDEEKVPEPDVFIEKLSEVDRLEAERVKAEEAERLFDEEQKAKDAETKAREDIELNMRVLNVKKKLFNMVRLLQGKEIMRKGGLVYKRFNR